MLPQHQPLSVTQPKVHTSRQSSSSSITGLQSLDAAVPLDFSKLPSLELTLPQSLGFISPSTQNPPAKPSPDRYRRAVKRIDTNDTAAHRIGSPSPSGGQLYSQPMQSNSLSSLNQYSSYRGSTFANPPQQAKATADDMLLTRSQNSDLAARYRRRSLGSIETAGLMHGGDGSDTASPHPNAFMAGQPQVHQQSQVGQAQKHRPGSAHAHTGSSESAASSRSARSSRPSSATNQQQHQAQPLQFQQQVQQQQPAKIQTQSHIAKQDIRSSNVRPTEVPKRNPSPLSRPLDTDGLQTKPQTKPQAKPPTPVASRPSPAAEQLAALTQKDAKKSKSNKLRRAFSFGSTAELRKATEKAAEQPVNPGRSTKRNSKYQDELEPEQARIAEKQEAAGLGESIYSGQGRFFTGSTDNLSISSTASSASIMLRKMGKGVKKGTRSFVGLFRPKSVIGVPCADGPVNEASAAQVSMVNVEAEREKVNVNVNPHDQAGGGTGFPKLERNSIDTKLSMESATVSSDRSRRSIVGGERERAEVLAAVKRGILKRTDSDKASPRVNTTRGPDFNLPQIASMNDSPRSSAPSTPNDDPPRSGHRRTDSIAIEGNDHDDYFASVTAVTRYASMDSKSGTPLAQAMRNISFSPRIQFHDTWPSGEYDRRGDIATCNRLTPMLAQQIKEELNTFKMVGVFR